MPDNLDVGVLNDYVSREELAKQLGVSERTLFRWFRDRRGLPRTKIGHLILYRVSAVRAWLETYERTSA